MDRAHVLHPYTDFSIFAQTGSQIIARVNGYHGGTAIAAALTCIHGAKYGFAEVGDDFIHHVSATDIYTHPDSMPETTFW